MTSSAVCMENVTCVVKDVCGGRGSRGQSVLGVGSADCRVVGSWHPRSAARLTVVPAAEVHGRARGYGCRDGVDASTWPGQRVMRVHVDAWWMYTAGGG